MNIDSSDPKVPGATGEYPIPIPVAKKRIKYFIFYLWP